MLIRTRSDLRNRRDRTQERINAWRRRLPGLVNAYTHWKYLRTVDTTPSNPATVNTWEIQVLGFTGELYEEFMSCRPYSTNSEHTVQSFEFPTTPSGVNKVLLHHGYLGASPERPTIAFTVNALASYRQLHRVCPRLSIEGFTKALLYIHEVRQSPTSITRLSSRPKHRCLAAHTLLTSSATHTIVILRFYARSMHARTLHSGTRLRSFPRSTYALPASTLTTTNPR